MKPLGATNLPQPRLPRRAIGNDRKRSPVLLIAGVGALLVVGVLLVVLASGPTLDASKELRGFRERLGAIERKKAANRFYDAAQDHEALASEHQKWSASLGPGFGKRMRADEREEHDKIVREILKAEILESVIAARKKYVAAGAAHCGSCCGSGMLDKPCQKCRGNGHVEDPVLGSRLCNACVAGRSFCQSCQGTGFEK